MQQSVVLHSCHREFQHIADEVWHHGTAAAALRIEVGNVGNRHVESEVKLIVPLRPAVEYCRPESAGTIFGSITVDDRRAIQELFTIVEQPSVVVQVLDTEIEPTISDAIEELLRNFVAVFRNNIERRFDSEGIIEIHQSPAKLHACLGLDIVRHEHAAASTGWPEPHEWNPVQADRKSTRLNSSH